MSVEEFVIVFAALSVGAFSKGLTGIGLPTITIPVLSGFVGVEHAVVVTTIPVAFSNIQIIWTWRARWKEIPNPWPALVAAAVGTSGGVWVLANFDDHTLTIIIICWIAFYLTTVLFNIKLRTDGKAIRFMSPVLGLAAGVFQGATGMSGPFIATWAHGWGFLKETYVFATSLMFLSISVSHVAGVSVAGLYDQERLIQGLLAIIPVLICIPFGMRMTQRVSPKLFNRVIICVIAAMEVKLIWGLVSAG